MKLRNSYSGMEKFTMGQGNVMFVEVSPVSELNIEEELGIGAYIEKKKANNFIRFGCI